MQQFCSGDASGVQWNGNVSFQSTAAPSHLVLMVISSEGNLFSGSASVEDASQWWERVSADRQTVDQT